jgi:hypothetical protein
MARVSKSIAFDSTLASVGNDCAVKRVRIGIGAAAVVAIAVVLVLAAGSGATPAAQRCTGAFPPKRPHLAAFKVSGMPCWAAKLLLDEALEQRVRVKRPIKLLGFTCRYKPETEASGVVSCTGHGASASAAFAVF